MDAAIASMLLPGAGKCFDIAPTVLRANCRKACAFGCTTWRSRTFGRAGSPAFSRANATAASAVAAVSPSTIRSNSFWPGTLASTSLFTGSPLTIMLSAVSRPSTRGSRCVPPAPGMRPIFTSGSAMLAPDAAMR